MSLKNAYIIGIDLGTTNCTLAYLERPQVQPQGKEEPFSIEPVAIQQMPIEQYTGLKTSVAAPSLPSFLYFPLAGELKALKEKESPLAKEPLVGLFAKERSGEVAERTIASAKSWLCHLGIDRRSPCLPLREEKEGDFQQLSPLAAIAHLLTHLKTNWDRQFPDAPFKEQQCLVTVPASFDPSARQLVQEACQLADYPEVLLLEEPQAAFYHWLYCQKEQWRQELKVGDVVLVVDIGGGTTDFSLITVKEEAGNLQLERVAVGQHLLLGGDNIDLALAYCMQNKFEEKGHFLEEWQFKALQHACRKAKETLLDPKNGKKSLDIAIQGRGSKLVGGTIKAPLTLEELSQVAIEGFIPLTSMQEQSAIAAIENKAGLKQLGLPYATDPRISCQLAKFLSLTGEGETGTHRFLLPTKVLFNGGTVKSAALRERLLALLNSWAQEMAKEPVEELKGADYDFAVSQGAVYYALAREGKGIRIRSGTSRSYFIGVEEAVPAVPGIAPPIRAICIAPYGMEEGSEVELKEQEFQLLLSQSATFRFFSHATAELSSGTVPTAGFVLKNWKKELTELHPIETVLESDDGERSVKVTLKAKVTELGVLELYAQAEDGRHWKLEFDIRKEN